MLRDAYVAFIITVQAATKEVWNHLLGFVRKANYFLNELE